MSAEAIARWNAIPMSRPEAEQRAGMKRPREEDDGDVPMDGDDSDDNMAVASRTPSPPPHDQMDLDKYDEYVAGPAREVITVDTRIGSTNKGFAMLAKLGWSEGQPLGLSGDGRVDPIPFTVKQDLTGLGKTSQDVRMIETTVSQRRGLDSERQRKETEDQRKARQEIVAKRAALQTEISETLKAFYCAVCDKQFQNVAQYDEHTNSYAHHHKVRFRDMQAAQRQKQNTEEEVQRRNEKERKREEKHLRKIAAAAGVKMAKPPVAAPALDPAPAAAAPAEAVPKKSGWATVSTPAAPAPARWASAGSGSAPPTPPPPDQSASSSGWARAQAAAPPAPAPTPDVHQHHPAPAFRTGGWSSLDTTTTPPPPPPALTHQHDPAPAFRTGGWAKLDATTSTPPPPQVPSAAPLSPPPIGQAPPLTSGWVPHPPPAAPPSSGFRSLASSASHPPPPVPQDTASPIVPASFEPKVPVAKKEKDQLREKSRAGWQSFQRGGKRK